MLPDMLLPRGMTIDTLGFARRLEASGFQREHAEAYATVLLNALGERNGAVSAYDTRAHVSQLEAAGVSRQHAEGWVNALPLAIGECHESPSASARSAMNTAARVFSSHDSRASPCANDDGLWLFLLCVAALLAVVL